MLNGRTTLILEKEFLIALDIQRILEDLGAGQTLVVRTPIEAEQLRHRWPEIALAIVETDLGADAVMDLADALLAAGIGVVLTTADLALHHGYDEQPSVPLVLKPVPEADLASAIKQALARRGLA